MGALTPIVVLLGITIIVLLATLCWVLRKFHESTQNIMAQMSIDTDALKKKFCGELDPGKPVKHRVKPMPKEFVERVKKKLNKDRGSRLFDDEKFDPEKDPFELNFDRLPPHGQPPTFPAPSYPDFATPIPPLGPDFATPPPMPEFMQPQISVQELIAVLKVKPTWDRAALLDELNLPRFGNKSQYGTEWRF